MVLLVIATLTQGFTDVMERRAEASVDVLSRAGRLSAAVADVEAAARGLERNPDAPGIREALERSVLALDRRSGELVELGLDQPASGPAWDRIALGTASVIEAAEAVGANAVVGVQAAQRLRARCVVLRAEADSARTQVEAQAQERRGRLRWFSWGAWAALVVSILGVSRWVLSAALAQLDRDGEELAEAERAVLDAADGERVRLGQELHDGLCQQLGGLRLLATAVGRGSLEPNTQESLATLEGLAAKALDMARALSHGLYPGDVRAENLSGALERLGAEVAELGGFEYSFDGPAVLPSSVSDEDAMQLYRIAQEALSNAVRHGRPGGLRVSLQSEPLTLCVEDDGVGLSATHDGSTTAGVGLSSMNARARALNARIRFFSTPHQGTRIVVTRAEQSLPRDALAELSVTPLTPWKRS